MDNSGNNQCGTKCSTEGGKKGYCPVKCLLLPGLVVFAVILVFNWVFHGILMMPSYKATASVWRSEEQMQSFCYIGVICQLITALVITCLYGWLSSKKSDCDSQCPIGLGAKFGFKIGVLLGITQLNYYVYLPIPKTIALSWFAGGVVEGVLVGVVLGFLYRMKCKKEACKA